MSKNKRAFIIVLDSLGIGELPDAADFGDAGSNTLKSLYDSGKLYTPNLKKLGLYNIDGVSNYAESENSPIGAYARMAEQSKGKDTTIGHWEIAGIISEKPLPVFPDGFPEHFIREFEKEIGRKTLCNKPYSGTDVIRDFGQEHIKTGALIVYTSADSVFQIAAHEDYVSIAELYRCCEIARSLLHGDLACGRVIARPFTGEYPNFKRTSNRHDFSLNPPSETLLDCMQNIGLDTIGVGKIYDIFNGRGVSEKLTISSNHDGMEKTIDIAQRDFNGLCFVNLVDFDMIYGHRNDIAGYTNALNEFDVQLGQLLKHLRPDDLLIITADHGCDPKTPSTDHSREYVPMVAFSQDINRGINLGTRKSFSDVGKTVAHFFALDCPISGESFLPEIME